MSDTTKIAVVIDDDADTRDIIKAVLEDEGFRVVEGEDGEELMNLALRECPDIIVLDVMMPVKSGFEALRELREDPRTEHYTVIMLTAVNDYELGMDYDADSTGRRLRVRPPEAFLDKPLDGPSLRTAINDALS